MLGKTPQAFTSPVKNAPSALLSKKAVQTPTPLKQVARSPATGLRKPGLLSPAKAPGNAKETESSESSSSESETSPVPISQKVSVFCFANNNGIAFFAFCRCVCVWGGIFAWALRSAECSCFYLTFTIFTSFVWFL